MRHILKKLLAYLILSATLNTTDIFATEMHSATISNVRENTLRMDMTALLLDGLISIQQGQAYDQSNDPAFMKSGPADETPQHGYFAVPGLVLGLAGLLLYFSRFK